MTNRANTVKHLLTAANTLILAEDKKDMAKRLKNLNAPKVQEAPKGIDWGGQDADWGSRLKNLPAKEPKQPQTSPNDKVEPNGKKMPQADEIGRSMDSMINSLVELEKEMHMEYSWLGKYIAAFKGGLLSKGTLSSLIKQLTKVGDENGWHPAEMVLIEKFTKHMSELVGYLSMAREVADDVDDDLKAIKKEAVDRKIV